MLPRSSKSEARYNLIQDSKHGIRTLAKMTRQAEWRRSVTKVEFLAVGEQPGVIDNIPGDVYTTHLNEIGSEALQDVSIRREHDGV